MSYENAVASMLALGHELAQTPSHKFDLAHMRVLLEALDHPERRFPSVLIAGTNGKGSTAATLASILNASGLKKGLCMGKWTGWRNGSLRRERCRGIPASLK